MNDWLTQAKARPEKPDPSTLLYIRSFLILRLCIGAIGIALPFVLVLGDLPLSNDGPIPRDSLSAYYFSGVRDYFVAVLAIVAVFLITYKVAEKNLDNLLSLLAGIGALAVALFPTGAPTCQTVACPTRSTPLQNALGEKLVQVVHISGATLFIGSLGLICYFFGVREGKREIRSKERRSPQFWQRFHWTCTATIGLAILFLPIGAYILDLRFTLLITEVVSVFAFGISWLLKGFERDILRYRPFGNHTPVAVTGHGGQS